MPYGGTMLEVRLLGRGGQGAVLAAELLAEAAFLDGTIPQSFPFFGVERRGAPVTAYVRLSDRSIPVRGSIARPDVLVVLEPGLLGSPGATEGLRTGGWALVNAGDAPGGFAVPSDVRLATVDATGIAREHHLGTRATPIVNTVLLGAFARLTGAVALASLERAIGDHVPRDPAANQAACRDGFDRVRERTDPGERRPPSVPTPRPARRWPEGPLASVPSSEIATASWRTLRPEVDRARCTRCAFCWKFCPDVAVVLEADGYPRIEAAHCKGCGICAEVCPPKAIAMQPEG